MMENLSLVKWALDPDHTLSIDNILIPKELKSFKAKYKKILSYKNLEGTNEA